MRFEGRLHFEGCFIRFSIVFLWHVSQGFAKKGDHLASYAGNLIILVVMCFASGRTLVYTAFYEETLFDCFPAHL